ASGLRGFAAHRVSLLPLRGGGTSRCAAACRVFPRRPRHDARICRTRRARHVPCRAHRTRANTEGFAVTRAELARLIDHSVLRPEASEGDINTGANVVRRWKIAFYCVQPCWVAHAAPLLADTNARIVTVVGFPHGCDRSDVKARAAAAAHADGAREIDMVLNIGALKSGDTVTVGRDIEAVVCAVSGIPVKVILEATALTDAA